MLLAGLRVWQRQPLKNCSCCTPLPSAETPHYLRAINQCNTMFLFQGTLPRVGKPLRVRHGHNAVGPCSCPQQNGLQSSVRGNTTRSDPAETMQVLQTSLLMSCTCAQACRRRFGNEDVDERSETVFQLHPNALTQKATAHCTR